MIIEVSGRKQKKLAATFADGQKVHFGGRGCADFIQYSRRDGPAVARAKRRAYLARHGAKERWDDPRAPSTLSRYILWEKPTLAGALAAYKKRFGFTARLRTPRSARTQLG